MRTYDLLFVGVPESPTNNRKPSPFSFKNNLSVVSIAVFNICYTLIQFSVSVIDDTVWSHSGLAEIPASDWGSGSDFIKKWMYWEDKWTCAHWVLCHFMGTYQDWCRNFTVNTLG